MSLGMFFLMWPPLRGCVVYAASQPTKDFCYSMQVMVTNKGVAVTDHVVFFTVDAAEFDNSNYIKPSGLDMRVIDRAGNDASMFAQDLTSNTSRWWLLVDSLAARTSETFTVFMGGEIAWRNNGLPFNGASEITKSHEPAFNITDNLRIEVIAEAEASHSSAGVLVNHWTANTGYRLGTIDISGSKYVRAQVDNETLDVAWDGAIETIRMEYQDPTLEILFYDDSTEAFVSQGTLTTSSGAIGTNSEALDVGHDSSALYFTGTIRAVDVQNSIDTTPVRVLRWGLHALQAAETSDADPTYIGTVQDDTANNYDGTYTISSSGTFVKALAGVVANNFSDAALTVQSRLFADILGDFTDTDLTAPGGASASIPYVTRIQTFATEFGQGNEAIWMIVFTIASIIGAVTMLTLIQSTPLALAVPGFLLTLGGVMGMLSPWVPIVYGLVAVGSYGLIRIGRTA